MTRMVTLRDESNLHLGLKEHLGGHDDLLPVGDGDGFVVADVPLQSCCFRSNVAPKALVCSVQLVRNAHALLVCSFRSWGAAVITVRDCA